MKPSFHGAVEVMRVVPTGVVAEPLRIPLQHDNLVPADLDGDGLADLVYTISGSDRILELRNVSR